MVESDCMRPWTMTIYIEKKILISLSIGKFKIHMLGLLKCTKQIENISPYLLRNIPASWR